jgi:serine/threonine-protein kinase
VIHRDLKPDNIFVLTRGGKKIAKVLDFGVAKVAGSARLTRTGMVFGTPFYMSPEQASGAVVDSRTDIYALGVIMYEMFTGKVPFESDTYMGVLTKHLFELPPPPSQRIEPGSPLGAIEDVILRALSKRPEERYSTMLELIGAVDESVVQATNGMLEPLPRSRKNAFSHRSIVQNPFREAAVSTPGAWAPRASYAPIFVGVVIGIALAIVLIAVVRSSMQATTATRESTSSIATSTTSNLSVVAATAATSMFAVTASTSVSSTSSTAPTSSSESSRSTPPARPPATRPHPPHAPAGLSDPWGGH